MIVMMIFISLKEMINRFVFLKVIDQIRIFPDEHLMSELKI